MPRGLSFEQIYASVWHHPILFWIVGIPFFLWLASRGPAALASPDPRKRVLWWLLAASSGEIVIDAWLTGKLSPIAPNSVAATAAGVTFVILGDLRYLALLLRFADDERPRRGWWAYALGLALVVPIASNVTASALWPADMRRLFLCYELMFATLAVAIRVWWLPRLPKGDVTRWLERLTVFQIVQYLGWASADLVILSGYDLGYLWRLVPNTMYYAAMLPFAWAFAPAKIRP